MRRWRKKSHAAGWWAVLAGMLAMWPALIVTQVGSWTDWKTGLFVGVVVGGMTALLSGFPISAWVGVIAILYQWRKWRRFRFLWMMVPAMLMSVAVVWSLVALAIDPPNARSTFLRKMDAEMPADARNVRWYVSGGLTADHHDVFYFETTPAEVDRLVAGMKLEEERNWEAAKYSDRPPEGVNWLPDMKTWDGGLHYGLHEEHSTAYYYLRADAARKRVLVMRMTY